MIIAPTAIPAHAPQVTAGCFGKEGPPPPTGDLEMSYNPQDSVVMEPGTTVIEGVGAGPSVEKAKVKGAAPEPNNGTYVYPKTDQRFHSANALAATAKTIKIFEEALGEPISWAFRGQQLGVVGDGGRMLNAYYSRNAGTINFFHADDPVSRATVYSGDSGEVVSHEAGHAILDGLRPSYLGTWSPAPGGFHESFGDVIAMLVSLKDDRVLAKVVEETGGDLRQPNCVAHLGEELGVTINHTVGGNATGGDYTRTAINDFVWQDPSTLPDRGGPDQLTREVHSYSRLWTGAFYDVFEGIVGSYQAQGQSFPEALRSAADEGLQLYGALMKYAPNGDHTYRDMAEALLQADQQHNGGQRSELIRDAYTRRRILPEGFSVVDHQFKTYTGETRSLSLKLQGSEFGQFEGARVETIIDEDGSVFKDAETRGRLAEDMKHHIDAGRVLFTTPGQQLKDEDYFDKDGNPYIGVVRWESGDMAIERSPILASR